MALELKSAKHSPNPSAVEPNPTDTITQESQQLRLVFNKIRKGQKTYVVNVVPSRVVLKSLNLDNRKPEISENI